jgi:hypothetical protein
MSIIKRNFFDVAKKEFHIRACGCLVSGDFGDFLRMIFTNYVSEFVKYAEISDFSDFFRKT